MSTNYIAQQGFDKGWINKSKIHELCEKFSNERSKSLYLAKS